MVQIGQALNTVRKQLNVTVSKKDLRPAGTQPELPPPQTIISTSSRTVMIASWYGMGFLNNVEKVKCFARPGAGWQKRIQGRKKKSAHYKEFLMLSFSTSR